jgi:hypothetical protein
MEMKKTIDADLIKVMANGMLEIMNIDWEDWSPFELNPKQLSKIKSI